MRHVRQALLVIVVVVTMYFLAGRTAVVLSRLIPGADYALFIWADRLAFLVWGALAGALLMRFVTWRLRLLAMLAIPVLAMLVVPNIAYLRARSIIQGDVSYLAMWPYYVYLGIPVAGMIAGALLAGWLARARSTDPGSAGIP